ncbi:MAG: CapA family protein [Gammaproteobacteria bacterium]|nr:CapA family protein [Gammaproteobacteria bacterium]
MKYISFVLLIFAGTYITGCSTVTCCNQADAKVTPLKTPIITKPDITIIAVGDIMLGTNFPDDRLAINDGAELLTTITPILKAADITFGNLEGVLMEGGTAAKKCKRSSSCYVFRSPPHYAGYLKKAGFDILSLANNHARDFGEEGRTATMAALNAAGLLHSGRTGDIARWQVKGTSVALIAFAPFGGSHDLLDIPQAQKIIKNEVLRSDIVLISIHAGAEGNNVLRIPFKHEVFYGENRGDVVEFSHAAIDAGADLVIGHGPHVPRALELYKNRLIAYSLGNFSTYQGINIRGENGLAPVLAVTLSATGQLRKGEIISARQQRPQGVLLDNSQSAAKLIAKLTLLDFPATPLIFTQDYKFYPKAQDLGVKHESLLTQ